MTTLLNLDSVRFGWVPNKDVLDIPSFVIEKHEHVFVMGPSGAGKSTLLSLIGGVIEPRCGGVTLNGVEYTNMKPARRDQFRADNIGFIFQQFNLVPHLSAYDNVLLPCRFSRYRAKSASISGGRLEKTAEQLLHGFFSENYPDFYQPVNKLSVGQQQRVAAARALIGNPSLIIADEPTSMLI